MVTGNTVYEHSSPHHYITFLNTDAVWHMTPRSLAKKNSLHNHCPVSTYFCLNFSLIVVK
jgi:hypothetical protein